MSIQTHVVLSWLLSIFFGVAVLYFVLVAGNREQSIEELAAGPNATRSRWHGKGLFLRYFGWLVEILGELISLLPLGKRRERLQTKLVQAGNPGGLSADEFYATGIIGIVALGLAGSYIDFELDMSPTFTALFALLGLAYPGIWLNGYVQKRQRRIFRDLPDLLDILRLAIDAGLDFGSAMKVVVEKGRPGPLLYELEKVERDMALGRTRQQAFRDFSERLNMSEINAFVLALIQADQLGASIGPILRVQGEMARKRRWQVAETIVNKLPMKMLGPLVVFIFPAAFIILFTPLIIQYMQGEG